VFIPIAEETGMIGALGRHVLESALRAMAAWRRRGLVDDDTCVSVNVSARQIDDPDLPRMVLAAIAAGGIPACVLRLEITESVLVHEPERVGRLVAEVCSSGVGLHLDDYGTGYSSLSALHRFPVEALKIDRGFISQITEADSGSEVIVRSTVALAHGLGLRVIAEGVEHPAQAAVLRELGCDYGQGFLFGRPLPAEECERALEAWSPRLAA
jgi:EAL domain-containing protein (putative c-di-GMP-specific phosphodiesterase class I)